MRSRFRVSYLVLTIAAALAVGGVSAGIALGGNSAAKDKAPPTVSPQLPTSAGCVPGFCYYYDTFTTNAFSQSFGGIFCPSQSWHVSGGGFYGFSISTLQNANSSFPVDSGADLDGVPDDGWGVWMNNGTGGALQFRAWAVCRTPQSFFVY
jgi:hypothetical protein